MPSSLHTFHNIDEFNGGACQTPLPHPDDAFEKPFLLYIISDGSMATGNDTKGRSGHITFRRLGNIVHKIQWSALKLWRVVRSSATAEILSASEAMSTGLYMHEIIADF